MKSNERAANAIKDGRLADEIVPVSIPQRKGEPILVETDEGVRPGTTMESLGGAEAVPSTRRAPSPRPTRHRSATVGRPS